MLLEPRGPRLVRVRSLIVTLFLVTVTAACGRGPLNPSSARSDPRSGVPATCATVPTVPAGEIVYASQGSAAANLSVGDVLAVVLTVPESSGLSKYPWAPILDSDTGVLEPVPYPGSPISCSTSESLLSERFAFRAVKPGTVTLTASVQIGCPSGRACGIQPLELSVTVKG